MKVEDLIKELQQLPENSTIGMIDIDDGRLITEVFIRTNKDKIFDLIGDEIFIDKIEKMRLSNKEKVCNYYIV